MADEDDEDTDMKQVRSPHQLAAAQQLTRSRSPRVLLAIEANEAAEKAHGGAEVRVPAKHDRIERLHVSAFLMTWRSRGANRPSGMAKPGDQAFMAAGALSLRSRTEAHFLFLPCSVERLQIHRIAIGFFGQLTDKLMLRGRRRNLNQRIEDGFVA